MFKLIGFLLPLAVHICIFAIGVSLFFLLRKKYTYYVWYNMNAASAEPSKVIKVDIECGDSQNVVADKVRAAISKRYRSVRGCVNESK